MFRRLQLCHFRPLCPSLGGFVFIIIGGLTVIRRVPFRVFRRFGHVVAAALLLLLSAFLAMFKRLHFCYFGPFGPCSGGCNFISCGHF